MGRCGQEGEMVSEKGCHDKREVFLIEEPKEIQNSKLNRRDQSRNRRAWPSHPRVREHLRLRQSKPDRGMGLRAEVGLPKAKTGMGELRRKRHPETIDGRRRIQKLI
jgi:hypothetical protein